MCSLHLHRVNKSVLLVFERTCVRRARSIRSRGIFLSRSLVERVPAVPNRHCYPRFCSSVDSLSPLSLRIQEVHTLLGAPAGRLRIELIADQPDQYSVGEFIGDECCQPDGRIQKSWRLGAWVLDAPLVTSTVRFNSSRRWVNSPSSAEHFSGSTRN